MKYSRHCLEEKKKKKKKGKEDEMISEKGICFKKRKPESHLVRGEVWLFFSLLPEYGAFIPTKHPKGFLLAIQQLAPYHNALSTTV